MGQNGFLIYFSIKFIRDLGFKDNFFATKVLAESLGLQSQEVLINSTGVIGVRIPMNKTCIELASEMPVVTTSANLHGKKIAENIEEAKEIFGSSCYYLEGEKPRAFKKYCKHL